MTDTARTGKLYKAKFRRRLLIPIGLASCLAGLIALDLLLPLPQDLPAGQPVSEAIPADPAVPLTAPAPPPSSGDYLARPLFVDSRRPAPEKAAPAGPSPAAPPPVAPKPVPEPPLLIGIIAGSAARIAVLRPPGQMQDLRVQEGFVMGEWRVERIFPDHVVLRAGDDTQDIGFVRHKDGMQISAPNAGPPNMGPLNSYPHP